MQRLYQRPHRPKRNAPADRFHDNIIRIAESFERIQNYIENLRPSIEKRTTKILLVGRDGIEIEEFLAAPVSNLFD